MKDKSIFIIKTVLVVVFFSLVPAVFLVSCLVNLIIRAKNKKLVETPLGQYIEVDGHRMSVLVKGQGAHTIVFLPGLCSTSPILEFKPLYSLLENEFRIVVPEKFGYGQSDIVKENRDYMNTVEQYRKALAMLGIEGPYILCAHSLGGNEVELWEQHYPDEVEVFAGIDANLANYTFDWSKDFWFRHWKLEAFGYHLRRIAGWCRNDFRPGLKKLLTKEERRIYRELSCKNDGNFDTYSEQLNKSAASDLINSRPLPTQPTIQFVNAPAWYVKGEEGKFGPYEEDWIKAHQDFAAASERSKILYFDCGHCIHCFAYEQLAKEIKEFVNPTEE